MTATFFEQLSRNPNPEVWRSYASCGRFVLFDLSPNRVQQATSATPFLKFTPSVRLQLYICPIIAHELASVLLFILHATNREN